MLSPRATCWAAELPDVFPRGFFNFLPSFLYSQRYCIFKEKAMHSITGNFILSKTFLNRKKDAEEEERAGERRVFWTACLEFLARGVGLVPTRPSPYNQFLPDNRSSAATPNQTGPGSWAAFLRPSSARQTRCVRLCSRVSASDGRSVAGEASSPGQLCVRRSLLQVANFTSL